MKLIETKYLSSETAFCPIDFARKAQFLTLDVISAIAFGNPFGYLTKDEDLYDYVKTTEETLPVIILVGVIPSLMKLLQSPIMKLFMPSHKDKIGLGRIMGYVYPDCWETLLTDDFKHSKEYRRRKIWARKDSKE